MPRGRTTFPFDSASHKSCNNIELRLSSSFLICLDDHLKLYRLNLTDAGSYRFVIIGNVWNNSVWRRSSLGVLNASDNVRQCFVDESSQLHFG